MILLDVNVWVAVLRDDDARHEVATTWLESLVGQHEEVGISELALSGAVRVVTHPRVFDPPGDPGAAVDACARLLSSPVTRVVRTGDRHWQIFDRLVRQAGARGNDVPDAYHAALAIEHGASLATYDRGLARFEGLRLIEPPS